MSDPLIKEILTFWFGDPQSEGYGNPRPMWFNSTEEIDQTLRFQYEKTYEKAKRGDLDDLKHTPEGALALILILDQFPRNMFRGTAKALQRDSSVENRTAFAFPVLRIERF